MKKSSAMILSISLLMSMTLAACSKGDAPSATPSSSASGDAKQAKPTNLSIFWWGTQPRHDATNKVLELYSKENPNITFSPEYTGFDGYYSKLTMLAASNNMPDIFQWYVSNDQYYQKDLVEPLDEYISKGIIDTKKISQSLIDSGKMNGKVYGIPLSTNTKSMYVDPEIYKKAGLAVPVDGYATWDDLEKDLVKLKAVTGAYGGDDVFDFANVFPYYARQYGQTILNANGLAIDEKTYVDYYTRKKRLMKEGLIPPVDVVKSQKGIEDSQTIKGKAAISFVYNNQLTQLEKAAGRDLQLIPLPGPNQEKGNLTAAGLHFAISANSKNKEEAAKFINYFINNVDANKILNGERGVPVSSDIRGVLSQSATPVQQEIYQFQDKIAQKSSPIDPPGPSNNAAQINELLKSTDEQILFDKLTPEAGYKKLKEEIAKLASQK